MLRLLCCDGRWRPASCVSSAAAAGEPLAQRRTSGLLIAGRKLADRTASARRDKQRPQLGQQVPAAGRSSARPGGGDRRPSGASRSAPAAAAARPGRSSGRARRQWPSARSPCTMPWPAASPQSQTTSSSASLRPHGGGLVGQQAAQAPVRRCWPAGRAAAAARRVRSQLLVQVQDRGAWRVECGGAMDQTTWIRSRNIRALTVPT